jgi:hypothetical protein
VVTPGMAEPREPPRRRRFLRRIDSRVTAHAARELAAFTKPVLIARASEDRFLPPDHARRLADLLPDARIEWIETATASLPKINRLGWQVTSGGVMCELTPQSDQLNLGQRAVICAVELQLLAEMIDLDRQHVGTR